MNKHLLELTLLKRLDTTSKESFTILMNLGNRFLKNNVEITETEYKDYVIKHPDIIPITLNLGKEI